MKNHLARDLRVRILAIVGATGLASVAGVACGSETSTPAAVVDAGDERGDAVIEADPGFTTGDAAIHDSSGDERPLTVRRPFLVGASLRSAASEVGTDWVRAQCDDHGDGPSSSPGPATRRELARVWLADGLEEHASIAAFARFTMMLLAVGAPPELVVASQRASIDEVAHARACFTLAHRYGGGDAMGPGVLDMTGALGAFTLADVAALTMEEGCLGETLGALLASEQLAVTTDPAVARVLTRIAADEARHAELAWRFVAWAIAEEQRGSARARGVAEAVKRAAARSISATRAMTIRPGPPDLAAWHAHGRVTCAEARAISERGIEEIVVPCLDALTGRVLARLPALEVLGPASIGGPTA